MIKVQKNLNDDTVIWRYMNISKFISLLSTNSLYFSRIDKLNDPLEGLVHYFNLRNIVNEKKATPEAKELLYNRKKNVSKTFVNCWTISENESQAFWNTLASKNDGIAIQSTIGALKNSLLLQNDIDIDISKITYSDINHLSRGYGWSLSQNRNPKELLREMDVTKRFLYKDNSLSYENELRLMIQSPIIEDKGLSLIRQYRIRSSILGYYLKADIINMIYKIVVSPDTEEFIYFALKDLMNKFKLDIQLEKSSLSNIGVWKNGNNV